MVAGKEYFFESISEGMSFVHEYVIATEVYTAMTQAFGDQSPIHVDRAAAARAGFSECVMHGAILNGFVSHFVGMQFPGASALLLGVELRYANPSFLGDKLQLIAEVTRKVESQRVIEIKLRFDNMTRSSTAAVGKALVKVYG